MMRLGACRFKYSSHYTTQRGSQKKKKKKRKAILTVTEMEVLD